MSVANAARLLTALTLTYGVTRAARTSRGRAVIHVARNRPIMRGVVFDGGAIRSPKHMLIADCHFMNFPSPIPAVEILDSRGTSALTRFMRRTERRLALERQRTRTARAATRSLP